MSIKSISLFGLLTYIARLSIQLYLREKSFPITYFSDFVCKSTTTGVVEIEMVPLYHKSAHTLRHTYLSTVADYLGIVESLNGVTKSLIQNVCTEFGISISYFVVVVLFVQLRDLMETIFVVF